MTNNTESLKVGIIEHEIKHGYVIKIDADNFHLVDGVNWYFSGKRVYRSYSENGERKHCALHRLIMNPPPHLVVDHIDGDQLNNTRENLRICTVIENNRNQYPRKGSTSKYKGVFWNKWRNKWIAVLSLNNKTKFLGAFLVEQHAAHAYNKGAVEYYGEFASLNPIGDD